MLFFFFFPLLVLNALLYPRVPLSCACGVCGKDTRDWKRSDVMYCDVEGVFRVEVFRGTE